MAKHSDLLHSDHLQGVAPTFRSPWDGVPKVENAVALSRSDANPGRTEEDFNSSDIQYQELQTDEGQPGPSHAWQLASHVVGPAVADGAPLAVSVLESEPLAMNHSAVVNSGRPLGRIRSFFRRRLGHDLGIGHERVMYAPLVVETAIGTSNTGIQFRADRGLGTPDRLEAIWASQTRGGPAAESRVDVLDTVFRMELGNSKVMAITEYTMRSLNPQRNDNTVGFGDMTIGAKATVLDGRCTKLATVFRTYLKTGPTDRGLGTGHVSLEPGVLLRQQLNEHTYFHGELKYWLPIAGTPGVAGDILKLGGALSTVWRETDQFALLPTVEFSSYTFLSGAATDSLGISRRVNGEFAAELYPGMRCVWDRGSELGLVEFGFASGAVFADDGWFDSRLRLDVRFVR